MLCQFYSGTVFLYICVYVTVLFIKEEEEEEEGKKKKTWTANRRTHKYKKELQVVLGVCRSNHYLDFTFEKERERTLREAGRTRARESPGEREKERERERNIGPGIFIQCVSSFLFSF